MKLVANKKLNLDSIKIVIFDFDDTLAIHKDRDYAKRRIKDDNIYLDYCLKAYLNPEIFYETIEPCLVMESLQKFIKICEKSNIKMYCVSKLKFSFNLKAKQAFVHKHYSTNIEVISSGTQELKCEAVKIIQRINKCDLNEILFVDDMKDSIIRFKNMGIYALLPEEVDKLIINMKDE